MNKLTIKYSFDVHECDTCGSSWSNGAVVKYDGVTILDSPANAHCFSNVQIEDIDILNALCTHLDIKLDIIEGD